MSDLFNTFFNWRDILHVLPQMLAYGIWNTLILASVASGLGVIVGMVLALMGISGRKIFRIPARVFVDIFRGLPPIVTILLIGQGFFPITRSAFGANPYPLGIAALGLISAAYMGEIFRSGIASVEKGQSEACRALGMSRAASLRLVVIPQGIRRVLPAMVNQFIAGIKDSSLVYFLGLVTTQRELFRIGQDASVNTGNLSPLVAASICYLAMTIPLTHIVNVVDRRLRVGRPRRPKSRRRREFTETDSNDGPNAPLVECDVELESEKN